MNHSINNFERMYIKNKMNKLFDEMFSNTRKKIFVDAFYEDDFIKIITPFVDGDDRIKTMLFREFYPKYKDIKKIENTDVYCFCTLPSIHQITIKINVEQRPAQTTFSGCDKDFMINYVFIEMPLEKRDNTILAIRDFIAEYLN